MENIQVPDEEQVRPLVSRIEAVISAHPLPAVARADTGVYIGESIGVGLSRDELANVVGQPMHIRVMAGVRIGNVAIEPWALTDLQQDRDGGWHGIIGGEPAMGSADLEHYG